MITLRTSHLLASALVAAMATFAAPASALAANDDGTATYRCTYLDVDRSGQRWMEVEYFQDSAYNDGWRRVNLAWLQTLIERGAPLNRLPSCSTFNG